MVMIEAKFTDLLARHRAVLLDAYGVLVDSKGALPGAVEAIAELERTGREWIVVTNDASRSTAKIAERLQSLGVRVTAERVLSSGALVAPWLRQNDLAGARCVVLGSQDSVEYARSAGGEVLGPEVFCDGRGVGVGEIDVVVFADDSGFAFKETMNAVLSMVISAVERGAAPRLVLANPDLIYPAGDGRYGFTAGTMALMVERALGARFDHGAPSFVRLGKPSGVIFAEALKRLGFSDAVMVGDQVQTDIVGAHAAGVASALVLTGVTTRDAVASSVVKPTYLLEGL